MFAQNTVGTIINNELAVDGYTLFAPSHNSKVYLINNCGEIAHQWETNENTNGSIHLYENGNLLYSCKDESTEEFYAGGKLGKLKLFDWNNNLLWENNFFESSNYVFHHDFEPLPNGNLLLILWKIIPTVDAIRAGKNFYGNNLWSEKLIEIKFLENNSYDIVWEWSAWDHIVQDLFIDGPNYGNITQNYGKIDLNYYNNTNSDWLHFNAISYNENDDLIAISTPTFNEIFIIDHSTSTQEAATSVGGKFGKGGDIIFRYGNPAAYKNGLANDRVLYKQHNVQWLAGNLPYGGNLLVFNNGRDRNGPLYSSADIISISRDTNEKFDLENNIANSKNEILKRYTFPEDSTLMYTSHSGSAQMLPNANVLFCSTKNNFFAEVTSLNTLAWLYKSPVSHTGILTQGEEQLKSETTWRATKILNSHKSLTGKNLTPKETIENKGNIESCTLFPNIYNNFCDTCGIDYIIENDDFLKIYPNPVNSELTIQNDFATLINYKIYNLNGILLKRKENLNLFNAVFKIDLSDLPVGTYIMQINNNNKQFKFIKY